MADTFISIPARDVITDDFTNSNLHTGTSSSAGDDIEIRIHQGVGITKLDVFRALDVFKRWILEGGQTTGTDANLPIL